MKKIYLIAAALLLAITGTGCGSKETKVESAVASQEQQTEAAAAAAEATIANDPTTVPVSPVVTEAPAEGELVEMQVVTEENAVQNVAGTKTQTSLSTIVMNQTGGVVSEFFVRLHPSEDDDEDEWGSDLIQTRFTLTNGDKMIYYYEKAAGSPVNALYDLRISYTDPERSECYFRNIPLETISQITLRMDGVDEDAIPYATYMTTGTTREYSTLNEVRTRLGLMDHDEEDEDEQSYYEPEDDSETDYTPEYTQDTEPDDYVDPGEISGDSNPQTDTMTTAESYVGQSLSSLEGAIGNPNGSDYEDEPGTGNTGYHYYGSFTVATSVDDNGNEIVTGIW